NDRRVSKDNEIIHTLNQLPAGQSKAAFDVPRCIVAYRSDIEHILITFGMSQERLQRRSRDALDARGISDLACTMLGMGQAFRGWLWHRRGQRRAVFQ